MSTDVDAVTARAVRELAAEGFTNPARLLRRIIADCPEVKERVEVLRTQMATGIVLTFQGKRL